MNLYLDCEFNSFGGELISIGIISGENHTFYREVDPDSLEDIHPWVRENVISQLTGLEKHRFQSRAELASDLGKFLSPFPEVVVYADWPEDFVHLMQSLALEGGRMIETPPLTMKLVSDLGPREENPHHALLDAVLLRHAIVMSSLQSGG